MEDRQIIDLFWERKEGAIRAAEEKYGGYCHKIAWNILGSAEDCEECLSDTWMAAWGCIPPKRPDSLPAFLGKITRSLAIDRLRKKSAAKRADLHLTSLSEEIGPLGDTLAEMVEQKIREQELAGLLNRFLKLLSGADQDIFVRRYWYLDPIKEIALRHGCSQSKIKSSLYRSRKKLARMLLKEFPEYQNRRGITAAGKERSV